MILLVIVIVLSGCDKCADLECYPGAPDIIIEFYPKEGLDSSYFDLKSWTIKEEGIEVRIRHEPDPNWNTSDPFMDLRQNGSIIEFYGTGIIWENLDDLEANLFIDYGNGMSDTLLVKIGEVTENCCTANFIDEVYFNDVLIERKPNEFSYNIDLGE